MFKWFISKKKLIEENRYLLDKLSVAAKFNINKINELEQNKTYVFEIEDSSRAVEFRDFLKNIEQKSLFTFPNIIIVSNGIKIKESD